MYHSYLLKGRQPSDCDATSWSIDRVKAAAKGPSLHALPSLKTSCVSWPCALSLRHEFTLLAEISRIFLVRVK